MEDCNKLSLMWRSSNSIYTSYKALKLATDPPKSGNSYAGDLVSYITITV